MKFEKKEVIVYGILIVLLTALGFYLNNILPGRYAGKGYFTPYEELGVSEQGSFGAIRGQGIPVEAIKVFDAFNLKEKMDYVKNMDVNVKKAAGFINKIDPLLMNVSFLQTEGYLQNNKITVIILNENKKQYANPNVKVKRKLSLIDGFSAEIEFNQLGEISRSGDVKSIYLNQVQKLPDPLDDDEIEEDRTSDNRNELIKSQFAWSLGYDGEGVTVAVLDTGVDNNHPDLGERVIAEESFIEGEEPSDGHGHGTHCATLVAGSGVASNGKYKGVAPKAFIMNGKVLSNGGSGSDDGIIAGIQWAIDNGADIISMSLGGDPTAGLNDALTIAANRAMERGVVMVIAAGNNGWY